MSTANPPTPATESAAAAAARAECDKLKVKYGVVTRTHRKGAKASSKRESHHALQDKAMTGLISKYSGWAILLTKTEHKVVNDLQIKRNCPGGGVEKAGATTFGQLQKDAKSDLKAGLKNRKDKDTKKPITPKDLDKLAECVVTEAVRETQKKRKKNKNKKQRKPLKQGDTVRGVKGCLAAGTRVHLPDGTTIDVAQLTEGMWIEAVSGTQLVHRVQQCGGSVRQLTIGDETVELSPEHFVQLANGAMRRADALRPGHVLGSRAGPVVVTSTRNDYSKTALFNVALLEHAVCQVGDLGLNIALPAYGLPVTGHVRLLTCTPVEASHAPHST